MSFANAENGRLHESAKTDNENGAVPADESVGYHRKHPKLIRLASFSFSFSVCFTAASSVLVEGRVVGKQFVVLRGTYVLAFGSVRYAVGVETQIITHL
jgi:hypothetical protein